MEEIAFNQGWLSKGKLVELANPLLKNSYGQYLFELE
uniref:Glucose-1-phosphate thymidylyltransferase n=1 Tax=Marinomonas sp. (strain MWYL1) TaxID=400668 RepID=A6VTH9_MARMS